ncbi:MAG: dTDP-glucose 4,6-dehydratase [Spirochaetes bacterium]|nr:dTDP-glucose 4,6-dehydratase [Spirochaetota bacterium]
MHIRSNYKAILVTGGCGFIGSNFIRFLLEKVRYDGKIINIDKLTYAGNPENLKDIDERFGGTQYFFERADICNFDAMDDIFRKYQPDCVVHFAAESHVDRSIHGPKEFINTNIVGTFNLLECCRKWWEDDYQSKRFHHVSTDEVYGTLGETGYFYETTPYNPRSPYSASKASSDHLVSAYHHTYGLNVTISNCSNNYGPYQFPEKLIPLMILNMLEERPLPIYGDGKNVRDWLYVEDHCYGVWLVLNKGKNGSTYNIGGENEWCNIDLVNMLCEIVAIKTNKERNYYKNLITFVKDRPGHDRRYAINCDKIKSELGFIQTVDFEKGLQKTVDWYLHNAEWVARVKSGAYLQWIEKNYAKR